MKKLLTILTILFLSYISFSQDYSDPQNMDVNYDKEAEYKGGMTQFIVDIWDKMEYTKEAIEAKIDGEIMVSFDINPDGSVTDISIIDGLDYGINEEFKRVLSEMKFTPATAEGNKVKQNMLISVPIRVGPRSKQKDNGQIKN